MKFSLRLFIFLLISASDCKLQSQIFALDSLFLKDLKTYDIVFIGEQHKIQSTESVECKIIESLKSTHERILMELPFDLNHIFKVVNEKRDTVTYTFPRNGILARYFYSNNIKVKAIDVMGNEFFLKDPIKGFISDVPFSAEIKTELNEFMKIGYIKPPCRNRIMKQYVQFLDKFEKNRSSYSVSVGSDSTFLLEYFDALRAYLNGSNDINSYDFVTSTYREDFLVSLFTKEIVANPQMKIIAINGLDHISMDNTLPKYIRNEKWVPLACRIRSTFPNKKISSVYLLNRKKDVDFTKLYKKEWDYLLENTDDNRNYFIKLDYENSPFKTLLSKYTHIILYN